MPGCCARAASGQAATELAITLMKSRRRMQPSACHVEDDASFERLSDKRGSVRFGPRADICSAPAHVRLTPKSGHSQCKKEMSALGQKRTLSYLFDHVVGEQQE